MERRVYVDCREFPESKCSLRISGTEEEVLVAAYAHAINCHGHAPTPEFRRELQAMIKEERTLEPA